MKLQCYPILLQSIIECIIDGITESMVMYMNPSNVEKDMYNFVSTTGLMIANNFFHFAPDNWHLGLIGLVGVTTYMLIGDFIGHNNNWEKIFKSCRLHTAEKEYPILLKEEENALGKRYTFEIPNGMCFNDFERQQKQLETCLREPLKLDLTKDYSLIIQTYNLKYKNVYKLEIGGNENVKHQ